MRHNRVYRHRRPLPAFIGEYTEAFSRAYPSKRVEVRPRKQPSGEIKYSVIIDEDRSDRLLSAVDMMEATAMFKR